MGIFNSLAGGFFLDRIAEIIYQRHGSLKIPTPPLHTKEISRRSLSDVRNIE